MGARERIVRDREGEGEREREREREGERERGLCIDYVILHASH